MGAFATYDDAGNVEEEDVSGSGALHTVTRGSTYDGRHQLLSHGASGTGWSAVWEYDKVGNWTVTNQHNGGGIPQSLSANADNEYTSVAGVTPQYRSTGELQKTDNSNADGSWQYGYDWAHRLVWVNLRVSGAWVRQVTYKYDALGRRASRLRPGGTVERQAFDGDRLIERFDYAGTPTLITSFYYGDSSDGPLALRDGSSGNTFYYLHDQRRGTQALISEGGNVVERYGYSPFGLTSIDDGSGTPLSASAYGNVFMFAGMWYESLTQLYWYRAREYTPTLGRFLQRDPAGYIDGYNLYAYCGNNPIRFIDPDGLDYIDVSDGQAYWVVERDGWFVNRDVGRVVLGSVSGNWNRRSGDQRVVTLQDGRTVSMSDLSRQANRFWNEYGDQSDKITRNGAIAGAINRVAKGEMIETRNVFSQQGHAALQGANAGALNNLNALTFGRSEGIKRQRDLAFDQAGLTGTVWETGSNIAAGTGAVAFYSAVGLAGASYIGVSEIGSVGLSALPSQIALEAYTLGATGSVFGYQQLMNPNQSVAARLSVMSNTASNFYVAAKDTLFPIAQAPSFQRSGDNSWREFNRYYESYGNRRYRRFLWGEYLRDPQVFNSRPRVQQIQALNGAGPLATPVRDRLTYTTNNFAYQVFSETPVGITTRFAFEAAAAQVPSGSPGPALFNGFYGTLGSLAGEAAQLDYQPLRFNSSSLFKSPSKINNPGLVSPRTCFVAGTLIRTADGMKPIESLQAGDRVWSYDFNTSSWLLNDVLYPMTHDYSGDIVRFVTSNETVTATSNHPVWVIAGDELDGRPPACDVPTDEGTAQHREGRWVEASHLRVGDVLLSRDGEVRIAEIWFEHAELAVYNICVNKAHNYTVGSVGLLVHNKR